MSTLDEKLHRETTTDSTRARARLEQLCQRWGCQTVTGTPPTVVIHSMTVEHWRHVSGKGPGAVYELTEAPTQE